MLYCKHTWTETYGEVQFEWEFSNYFLLSQTELTRSFKSHCFAFGETSWILRLEKSIFHNVWLHIENVGYRKEYDVEYEFGLKKKDGSVEPFRADKDDFDLNVLYAIYPIARVDLLKQHHDLAPRNGMTITCTLRWGTAHCVNQPLLHQREESLRQDYKKVFLNGQNHDFILKVGDTEFPVHRDILRARSRVFESMLSHDMKENNSGVIDVPDCEPNAMEQLLLYVYCGKVETLDESNMFGLYYAADKYDVAPVKEECSDFIKKSLSPTNACEVIQLALNHNDSSLQEYTTEYFCNNSHKIFRTLEWQIFMKDNSTTANELVIKSIDALRKVKKVRFQ